MIQNKNLAKLILVTVGVAGLAGCSYIRSHNPYPNQGSQREQMCSDLKNQMTFSQAGTNIAPGRQATPIDDALTLRKYQKYNCANLATNTATDKK